MVSRKTALASFAMTLAVSAHAAEIVDMGFFSVATPPGWHNESSKGSRLLSSKSGRAEPPLLIVELCKTGSGAACPSRCDIRTIEQSGMIADIGLSFSAVKRSDGYSEYAAAAQERKPGGAIYTSIRLLCGPAGFVYAALIDGSSAQQVRRDLDAIVNTIKWSD
jgi:hypothetical protein